MTTLREAAQQILEALEIGYDSAQAEATQYHAAMAGYRPERHEAMDADVEKIAQAIRALRAALAQEDDPHPPSRHCMCEACKPAFEPTPGPEQPSRAQRMRDAGYTRRPTLREKVEQEEQKQEPVAWMTHSDNTLPLFHKTLAAALGWGAGPTPLYTHPPRREWQSLTDEEVNGTIEEKVNVDGGATLFDICRAIEAKLKEKNA